MKKFLVTTFAALAAALALVTRAPAAPLDTRGIPAATVSFYHLDLDALAQHKVRVSVHAFISLGQFPTIPPESAGDSGKGTENNPQTILHSVTECEMKPSKNTPKKTKESNPENESLDESTCKVIIFRGKFPQEKLISLWEKAYADSNDKLAIRNIGKHKVYILTSPNYQTYNTSYSIDFISFVDASTVVHGRFHSPEKTDAPIKDVLDAFDEPAKSYKLPATLLSLGRETGTPILLAILDSYNLEMQRKRWSKASFSADGDRGQVAFGISDGTAKFRAVAKMANEAEAKLLQSDIERQIPFAKKILTAMEEDIEKKKNSAGTKEKSPRRANLDAKSEALGKAAIAECQKIFDTLKLTTKAAEVNFSSDHPADSVLHFLNALFAESDALHTPEQPAANPK